MLKNWNGQEFVFSLIMSTLFYRWALYPPGRVPGGVTVHVSDEDGDVDIDTPTSLQVKHLLLFFSRTLAHISISL
jgi:hypothetical protein